MTFIDNFYDFDIDHFIDTLNNLKEKQTKILKTE
jgi:hypothetical protein